MSSGFYSALSGNLAKFKALENISNNLSNANTHGYKRDRVVFESYLDGASQVFQSEGLNFTRLRQSFVDYTQGTSQSTGRDFDFAIEGEGFFKVKRDDKIFYTRLGQFKVEPDGSLLNDSNYQILGEKDLPIILPNMKVEVDEQGRILDQGSEVGRIPIYTFEDKRILTKQGGGLFLSPPGTESKIIEQPRILRGRLETSNVNMMQEMALMMETLRAFESYQKMIKAYEKMASKADEIGSL